MQILRVVRCLFFALLMMAFAAPSFAGVSFSVTIAPPALPVYEQPPCPGDGYIWTPGYWAYGPEGYYWVPGTWSSPPTVGLLWTPGYWGWHEGAYLWHAGYWGPHVGFYGGVNYGFGYVGTGYAGGYWRGHNFYYNRTVNNVHVTNVHIYNRTVINNVTVNRVSYNGGHGGINARPTHEQERWNHERHFEPTGMQREHEHAASSNRAFLASENHGRPSIAATARPGEFHGREVVAARSHEEHNAHDRHAENHPVSHEQRSVHEMRHDEARPETHQESHGNRAPQPQHETHQPENRPATHPSSYHPQSERPQPQSAPHQQNAPQHQSAPHQHSAPQHETHAGEGHNQKPR